MLEGGGRLGGGSAWERGGRRRQNMLANDDVELLLRKEEFVYGSRRGMDGLGYVISPFSDAVLVPASSIGDEQTDTSASTKESGGLTASVTTTLGCHLWCFGTSRVVCLMSWVT